MAAKSDAFPEAGGAAPSSEAVAADFLDFSFAYRNPSFSDRVLVLEIADAEHGGSCENVPVSRAVLAFKSPVFRRMFSGGMSEAVTDGPISIKLSSVREKEAFLWKLRFIYVTSFSEATSDESKSWEELLDLLAIADLYQVTPMISAVATILRKLPETVELLQQLAFDLPENLCQYQVVKSIRDDARASLLLNFGTVSSWSDPGFKALRLEAVELLLGNHVLKCSSEDEVFAATLKWLRETSDGMEEREKRMSRLSGSLRFAHMSSEYLQNHVVQEPEMQAFATQKCIMEGLLYKASSDSSKGTVKELRFSERLGVDGAWFIKLHCKAKLDAAGTSIASPPCESQGTKWRFVLQKMEGHDTVGIYLHLVVHPTKKHPLGLKFVGSFAARSRDSGRWIHRILS